MGLLYLYLYTIYYDTNPLFTETYVRVEKIYLTNTDNIVHFLVDLDLPKLTFNVLHVPVWNVIN
jgi:hypothetical protein